ncbi:MAG TPA: endonuclease/exonuclease/phosphatase family protein [Blastocatellia bacterium]|jgi:endonuclease/exonuclease/phosphatase family metal-dependent hydrolase|nr:endonuclease/exonuclease/phosphatase family protein [Blastocatellia bacterium]
MKKGDKFRIVTYNVHKCVGVDRRLNPARIVSVLKEVKADIVALQEVLCIQGRDSQSDQACFIAGELGFNYCMGQNRKLKEGIYGNLVLSRFPLLGFENHDISVAGREERGCLRVDVGLTEEKRLHVYNVHLGTSFIERRYQARKLIGESILSDSTRPGPRVMLGDFNEWTRGLVTRLLNKHFQSGDIRLHLKRSRTYPGMLPIMHLDHIYFSDEALELEYAELYRSRTALLASDHLPIFADFRLR